MLKDVGPVDRNAALDDYYHARRQGMIQEILARFTGKPVGLLSYEEFRRKLGAQTVIGRGARDIPLDAIVGSVNRYQDFTHGFFPRKAITRDRWAGVALASAVKGLPPIEVYQIGEVYFVKDGNHRVSAARELGWKGIQAYVEEVITQVPLMAGMTPDELILQVEKAHFIERTRLPLLRPQAGLELTAPGQYPQLVAHIATYAGPQDRGPGGGPAQFAGGPAQFAGGPAQFAGEIPAETVTGWYDTVYQPVAQHIEETGILRDFPGRTVTDLYLWTVEHRAALEEQYGQEIRLEAAARHLADRFSPRLRRSAARLGRKIKKTVIPKRLETGPSTGQWRAEKQVGLEKQAGQGAAGRAMGQRLFTDILVTVSGKPDGWTAFEQAAEVARREGASLHGLHVLKAAETREAPEAQALEAEFDRRCAGTGVPGKMIFGVGSVSDRICEQSRWNDLVVVNLTYPPPPQPFAALGPGFRSLVQHCPRPLLVVPRRVSALQRILLAYDGSPKAREALFMAAYLAGQWADPRSARTLPLVVITAFEGERVSGEALAEAWQYLDAQEIEATYIKATGPAIQEILITSEEQNCDLLLMGGHSSRPVLSPILGSTVDQVLREAHKPVLICR